MKESRRARTLRRKEDRARAKRIKRIQRDTRTSGVHMTVINASHDSDEIMSLSYELQQCNSALLYADQVTLVSPRAALIKNAQQVSELDGLELLKVFKDVAPKYFPEQAETLDELIKYVEAGAGESRVNDLEKQLNSIRRKMQENLQGIFADSGYEQLRDALDAGILGIDEVGGAVVEKLSDENDHSMVLGFVSKIDDVLTDGERYPLFDARSGEIVRLGVEAGFFSPVPMARRLGADAAMAGGLFDRLPNFQYATTREILDIRTELSDSLLAFRQGVRSLTEDIGLAPEDPDFSNEIFDAWNTKVAPAIEEIEQVIAENFSMRDLLTRAFKDPIGGATVGAGAALPATLAVAAGPVGAYIGVAGFVVGGTVAIGRSLIDEYKEIRSQKKAQFYFLYGTSQQLDPFRL
jgi:hypothetical protein